MDMTSFTHKEFRPWRIFPFLLVKRGGGGGGGRGRGGIGVHDGYIDSQVSNILCISRLELRSVEIKLLAPSLNDELKQIRDLYLFL